MTLYYSSKNQGFYDSEIHDKNIPIDSIQIDTKLYLELFQGQASGMSIVGDERGHPYLVPQIVSTVSEDQLAEFEKVWTFSEIDRVRDELEKVQDSDPDAIGTVGAWRDYRKALRVWNEHENFPNIKYRPVAPDAQE